MTAGGYAGIRLSRASVLTVQLLMYLLREKVVFKEIAYGWLIIRAVGLGVVERFLYSDPIRLTNASIIIIVDVCLAVKHSKIDEVIAELTVFPEVALGSQSILGGGHGDKSSRCLEVLIHTVGKEGIED